MAVTHWFTGHATSTTAKVVVRADATGNVPVVANGQTLQAACDTAVNDGNASVTFEGLTPGAEYAYTVGGVAGGVLKPMPVDAAAPFWLAFSSCWAITQSDWLAARLLRPGPERAGSPMHALRREAAASLRAFVAMGDLVYMNQSATINGYALLPIDNGTLANAKSVANRRNYYRAQGVMRGFRDLARNVPTYRLKDDHEYDPDNASHSTSWLDNQFPASAPHSGTDLDEVWTAATTAWREWATGNPASSLAGSDYYTVRIGPVELFCTDLIQERDYTGADDSATKRMMSAEQEARLLDDMAASSATFKVWVSSKQFVSSCGRNFDGWYNLGGTGKGYQTQLQRILADPRFPRAGALSITGDEHIKSDMWIADGRFGGRHAAISQISAGPATIDVITDPNDGLTYRDGVRTKERDTSGQALRGENNYVLLRVLQDRVERYVLGSRYGLRYMGFVSPAGNQVQR